MDSLRCEIITNQELIPGFYWLELRSAALAAVARPGQFLMVRPQEGVDPFLSRPFGFAAMDQKKGSFGVLYKVQGRGTQMMTALLPGTELCVLAPLGNGFDLALSSRRALVVAGGVGIAPLLPLTKALLAQGVGVKVLLGVTYGKDLIGQSLLEGFGAEVQAVSVDGTIGEQGMVPDYAAKELAAAAYDCVYACGPKIMLQKTAEQAIAAGVPCQVSLEERMGCGSGICMGCVCKIKDSDGAVVMRRVCHDGPVFDAREVIWDD